MTYLASNRWESRVIPSSNIASLNKLAKFTFRQERVNEVEATVRLKACEQVEETQTGCASPEIPNPD